MPGQTGYKNENAVAWRADRHKRAREQGLEQDWAIIRDYKTLHAVWPSTADPVVGKVMERMLRLWRDGKNRLPPSVVSRMRSSGFGDFKPSSGHAGKGKHLDAIMAKARDKTLSDEQLNDLRIRYDKLRLSERTADQLKLLGYDVRQKAH